jgi:hypothetical protein
LFQEISICVTADDDCGLSAMFRVPIGAALAAILYRPDEGISPRFARVRMKGDRGMTDVKTAANADGPDTARPVSERRTCADCRHQRMRSKARVFGAVELQTAAGLKAYVEWQQREKQHAEREAQLVAAGGVFTYEPRHYAWCAALTSSDLLDPRQPCPADEIHALLRSGAATLDPVSGRIFPVYVLCARANVRGDCTRHEAR